ncbi:class I SAM-dependent methyltransferase [Arthrobacter sp. 3Tela_A]|uniref:class I SAM-dependent methyltransferase n=1 Tax=Arthrobacter sp. 3Tela_A TaxID=3093743 RepID=UPI003BB6DB7A
MASSGPKLDGLRRRQLGGSYRTGAEHYDRIRPGYPVEAVEWLFDVPSIAGRAAASVSVADIGAGTGKYTAALASAGFRVHAVDPSADMLAQLSRSLPAVPVTEGTAEHTGLPDASFDAVTVAQAWHWCDPVASAAEFNRILAPGGFAGLIWNQLDVSVPWVHRFSRIIHAGDVLRPGFRPALGTQLKLQEFHTTSWSAAMTPEDLAELAQSRAYYLSASEPTRAKVLANLSWYLHDHLGHAPGEELQLPYLTFTWRAVRP